MKSLKTVFGTALCAAVGSVHAFGDEAKPTFRFYGFLLPTVTVASSAVESFSQPNMGAYTAAGNPILAKLPDDVRSSFQVVQSRFGFLAHPIDGTTANVEFDFIDFAKSSPTTAALPRVRRAYIDYQATEHLLLKIGQDWDLVSPLAPHSFNYVGHYFESGDIGFMRIQAQALYTDGSWEHAIAIGLPGNNNNPGDGGLELSHLPSIAVRETYRFSDKSRIGVSLFAASVLPKATSPDKQLSYAATGFFETPLGEGTELHTEAFVGQNTNNVGLLGLSFGTDANGPVQEAGGYVTLRSKMGTQFAVFGGIGGSWVLNPSAVTPSYVPVAGTDPKLNGSGPGISSNWTARLGAELIVNEKLKFFGEAASLATTHVLLPADAATDGHRTAFVMSVGSMASF